MDQQKIEKELAELRLHATMVKALVERLWAYALEHTEGDPAAAWEAMTHLSWATLPPLEATAEDMAHYRLRRDYLEKIAELVAEKGKRAGS